jgi:urease accessory protein
MKIITAIGAATGLVVSAALTTPGVAAGGTAFAHGFMHPFLGFDHLLAMLAVGIWAAQLGGRARWAVPATFVALVGVGGALALAGVALPRVEAGIAVSLLVMGLLIATAARLPTWIGMLVVGVFALLHGHAHGSELPMQVAEFGDGAGMLTATALLHAIGFGLATAVRGRVRFAQQGIRLSGAAIAAGGLWMIGAL